MVYVVIFSFVGVDVSPQIFLSAGIIIIFIHHVDTSIEGYCGQ
jgi:hypothetical protein